MARQLVKSLLYFLPSVKDVAGKAPVKGVMNRLRNYFRSDTKKSADITLAGAVLAKLNKLEIVLEELEGVEKNVLERSGKRLGTQNEYCIARIDFSGVFAYYKSWGDRLNFLNFLTWGY